MFARSRVLAAVVCVVGVGSGMPTPSAVVTAAPAAAPEVCTEEEERAADGKQEDVDACHNKRLASAQARFDNVPNAAKLRDRSPYEIEGTMGVTGRPRKSVFDSRADAYAALASEVVYVHCFALVEHGGSLCFPCKDDHPDAVCEFQAGGSRSDGLIHDDSQLPMKWQELKSRAVAAYESGQDMSKNDTLDERLQADAVEAMAAKAAFRVDWSKPGLSK